MAPSDNVLQTKRTKNNLKLDRDHRPRKRIKFFFISISNSNASALFYLVIILFNFLLLLPMKEAIAQATIEPLPPSADDDDDESTYYYVGCYTERTDLLKESVFSKTPQTCLEICEHQNKSFAVLSSERCFCTNILHADERQDQRLCNIRCSANKSQYCGGVGVHSYYSRRLSKLTEPHSLRVVNITEHSLVVEWQKYIVPKVLVAAAGAGGADETQQQTNREITNFLIKSNIVNTFAPKPYFEQPEFIVQSSETSFEMTDLHPATEYNITVNAMCGDKAICGSASIQATTLVGVPSPEPKQPRILATTDKTITIEIPPIRNDNGPVSKVLVIVEHVDPNIDQYFDSESLGSWQKAQDDGVPYYIAAELNYEREEENRTRKFVVGDGRLYGTYVNKPLENATKSDFHISLAVISTFNGQTKTLYARGNHKQHKILTTLENFTYATFDAGSESIIALTVTCVIFGICLALSVLTYFYLRYKTCKAHGGGGGGGGRRNAHEMTLQQPIIERENNGFVVEDELPATVENFKQQLNAIVDNLDVRKRHPRNALRMNINDIVAEGRYGEVITGKIVNYNNELNIDCQLHVISLDELSKVDQARLLQEFRNLTRLQQHVNIIDFYGVAASADWFYFIFEFQPLTLKKHLVESRRVPSSSAPAVQRLTTLSEELILQWIYELASACEYLSKCRIVHRQLCAQSVLVVAPESQLKLSIFGPVPNSNQRKYDLQRWFAPETLRYQHYSTKSDVWSFGCMAWECCSLGATPYANINKTDHLLDAIKSGSRPAQPAFVYSDLYQLLLNCWQLEPSDRISFEDITLSVRQLMTSPRHALCFDRQPPTYDSSSSSRAHSENNILDMLPFYLPLLETTSN